MSKPPGKPSPGKSPDPRQQIAREQRLAKALRDNLRRRKGAGAAPSEPTEDGEG